MARNLEFPHKFRKVSLFEDGKDKAKSIHLFVRSYYRWYVVAANIVRQESLQENIQKRCFFGREETLFWLINVIAFGFGFSTFPRASCLGWQTGFTKTYTCGWLALKVQILSWQVLFLQPPMVGIYHRGYPTSQSICSPSNQNWYCTPRNNAKDCTLWAPSSYKCRVK